MVLLRLSYWQMVLLRLSYWQMVLLRLSYWQMVLRTFVEPMHVVRIASLP
jgi:hypothetical protein